MRLLLVCLLVVALVTAACAAPKQVPAPKSFRNWTIAFVGNGDIWTAMGDGSGQKRIIRGGGAPCWSPDGSKLAFCRKGNIWTASRDGTHQKQLTHYGRAHCISQSETTISWSPRGCITFSCFDSIEIKSGATGRRFSVWGSSILDLNLSKKPPRASVRFDAEDGGSGFNFTDNDNPVWSRSGDLLAFTRNGDVWVAQYVPEKDGGRAGWDISRLFAAARYDSPTYRCSREDVAVTGLSWSPDGRRLAYCRNRVGGSGTAELHLITVKKNETPWLSVLSDQDLLDEVTPAPKYLVYQPRFPCFSPDGKWIAFWSPNAIYAISEDGRQLTKLIDNAERPVW